MIAPVQDKVVVDPFTPYLATVKRITDLTPDVKLFNLELNDAALRDSFAYNVGQFALVSVFGVGESPFDICSLAHWRKGLEFAVRRVGTVTRALHDLEEGATVGVRGPFGNWFPMEQYRGKDIHIIGGGIGMAPMRSVVDYILENRADYGHLTILNGARTPADLVFKEEFAMWADAPNTRLELTVDRGDADWKGRVALIPTVVEAMAPSAAGSVAIICGPPIMIKFTLQSLKKLGFQPDQIVTTMEAKMKCGLGKCGRCNIGQKYVCVDGPVFTFAEISRLIEAF